MTADLLRYYDKANRRLVYIGRAATSGMWDEHWSLNDRAIQQLHNSSGSAWLVRTTRRYLKPGTGPVLEGGCGTGQHVAALHRAGYEAVGIDFAPNTVTQLNKGAPHLDIRYGDLRALPLTDSLLAGYWSLGVIEHFYKGYESIAGEMARTIRLGGYLFLTFPYMSPLRRIKACLGCYPSFDMKQESREFYQFALDARTVTTSYENLGFQLVGRKRLSGLKGVKDEIGTLRKMLQKLYDYQGPSRITRGLRWMLDWVMAPLAGHTCLLVLRRI